MFKTQVKDFSIRKVVIICIAVLAAAILCGCFVPIRVLRVASPDKELLYSVKTGDKLEISSFHSLYHVTQTEYWTILDEKNFRMDRIYFGCYEAGEYYSTYLLHEYLPFSGAGDYYMDIGDIVQDNIRLIITPTSQFRIQLRGKTHMLYQEIHGFTDFSLEQVSLFRWLKYTMLKE